MNFNLSTIPRIKITHVPTPLESAPRLSKELCCQVFFKRDDCTGLAGGGNKVRKLEYLLADAKNQGADTLITIGGVAVKPCQTNRSSCSQVWVSL